jgi:hypothetical protein
MLQIRDVLMLGVGQDLSLTMLPEPTPYLDRIHPEKEEPVRGVNPKKKDKKKKPSDEGPVLKPSAKEDDDADL